MAFVNCAPVPDFLFSTIPCAMTPGHRREMPAVFMLGRNLISSLPGGNSPGGGARFWPERRGERLKGRNFAGRFPDLPERQDELSTFCVAFS